MNEAPDDLAEERLLRAIDAINENVALIELWACALSAFAHPAPDYGLRDEEDGDVARNQVSEAA